MEPTECLGFKSLVYLLAKSNKNHYKLKRFTKYTNYPNVVGLRNLIAEKLKAENKYCF